MKGFALRLALKQAQENSEMAYWRKGSTPFLSNLQSRKQKKVEHVLKSQENPIVGEFLLL